MKKLIPLSIIVLAIGAGCISTPLPSMKADLKSGQLHFKNLQDRNIEGLEIEYKHGTNSTKIKVKRDTANTNTNAVQSSVDGQVQMMDTVLKRVESIAGTVAEKTAKGASPAP